MSKSRKVKPRPLTVEWLRARVSVEVGEAPPPYPLTKPPGEEIKVTHIKLIVELTLAELGATVDENGVISLPKKGHIDAE